MAVAALSGQINQISLMGGWFIWPFSEPQGSPLRLHMTFRRTIDPTYKATRQTLAERRAAERRRQLERMDPPLGWVLSGPAWPCCPELAPEQ